MKILIQKNNLSTSLSSKLERVKKWFNLDLEFIEERVKLDIKYGNYYDSNGNIYEAPSEEWYDWNVSIPAKQRGFDIVIFVVKPSEWKSSIVEGFGTVVPDWGVEEICVPYLTNGTYNFNGVQQIGNKFEWILIHELLHRIYNIKKLPDNTHKYFTEGNPEKCLEDFKTMTTTWKYFKPTEWTNSQHTHTVAELDTKLVNKLDNIRDLCGFPLVITSGYRTEEENNIVGGVEDSAHTQRLAVDISCTDSAKRIKLVRVALNSGISRIGIGKTFIHLDISSILPQGVMWLY